MSDALIIIIPVSIAIGLIYVIYILLLGISPKAKKSDLQISTKDIYQQCKILFSQEKYSIVEKLAKKYLEKNPNHFELRGILAKTYKERGNIYEALEQAEIVIQQKKDSLATRLFLAECYKETSQASKAINELKEILKFDENSLPALKELAQIYLDTNQKQSAIKIFQQLLNHTESTLEIVQIHSTLGQLFVDLKDYKSAIEEYKTILEIYPDDNSVKKSLVELYKRTINPLKAIEMCRILLSSVLETKDTLWTLGNLIDLLLSLNRSQEALQYIEEAMSIPNANLTTLNEKKAEVFVTIGKIDDAVEILQDLTKNDEENIELKKALGKTYQAKKEYEKATEIYKDILDKVEVDEIRQIQRDLSNIYANWAMNLYDNGDNAESFKTFTIALHYDNENPRIFYMLGIVNQLILNFNEAISNYKKALEFDETNCAIYMALSECYEAINNVYEQKKVLMNAICYDKHNSKAYFKLAMLNYNQNDFPSAIDCLENALKIEPDYVEAEHKLALLYERQGDSEKAINVYKNILKTEPNNQEVQNNLKMLQDNLN